ncbi:unnamed protein product [Gadus morhua 'NCC']
MMGLAFKLKAIAVASMRRISEERGPGHLDRNSQPPPPSATDIHDTLTTPTNQSSAVTRAASRGVLHDDEWRYTAEGSLPRLPVPQHGSR